MVNARTEVAELGWEVYLSSSPRPSHEQINAILNDSGAGPVSPRTYRHYEKLERYQQRRYMPINELDQRTKRIR